MIQHINAMPEGTKTVGDIITFTAVLGTLVGYLPPLAALATIIWTSIRIWETETVQNIVAKLKRKAGSEGNE